MDSTVREERHAARHNFHCIEAPTFAALAELHCRLRSVAAALLTRIRGLAQDVLHDKQHKKRQGAHQSRAF
jgi:hypothetical protein